MRIIRKLNRGPMQYNTKQRELLLKFFNDNHDKTFSAEQIIEALKQSDISISAVYRNLSSLEKEGKIKKVTKSSSRKAYYQFLDCSECREHLHITCTKCGKTTHLPDTDCMLITQNILHNSKFNIDKNNTILYGLCDKCSK